MAEIRVLNYGEIVGFGKNRPFGDLNTPMTVALDSSAPKIHENRITVAVQDTAYEILRLGTSAGDDLPSFKYLRIYASVGVFVGFIGAAEEDSSVIFVPTGTVLQIMGPSTVGTVSDDTKPYNAVIADRLAVANTTSQVTKIYVRSPSGTGYVDVLAAF